MKLIAIKSMRYAGRALAAGDEFDASARDARILKAIKKADDATDVDSAMTIAVEPKADNQKAKYRTRRLKAEDDNSSGE